MHSKNLPASVLVKLLVCSDIQEYFTTLIILVHSFWKKQARRVLVPDGEMRMILSKVKIQYQNWKASSIFIYGGVFKGFQKRNLQRRI